MKLSYGQLGHALRRVDTAVFFRDNGENGMIQALKTYFEGHGPPGVASAYLFGSHAEGRAHRESDVDVAVLLDRGVYPERRDRSDVRVGLASDLIHALADNRVDVVVLNDAPPELGRRIVTSGRRVYRADPAADHAFVRDVQLRAADLAPFLRRMRRLHLERLRQ